MAARVAQSRRTTGSSSLLATCCLQADVPRACRAPLVAASFGPQAMGETDAGPIPHALMVNIIEDPPCVTLYVETALVQNPSTPGFKPDAKQEMLMAIAETVEREGLDGYRIVWSVPSPALAPVPIGRRTASAA
jgi:hypothetical protein